MSFTLRIRFAGLCLFVPRQNAAGEMRMHVLMPDVTNGGHCGERHIPVLGFDTAHLRPGQDRKDEIVAHRVLTGASVTIGMGGVSGFVCPQIVKLRDATGQDVPDDLLQPSPGTARLGARVTLAQGKMKRVAKGACWEWGTGNRQRMAHIAQWEIESVDDTLQLRLDPLRSGKVVELPLLYPIGKEGEPGILDLSVHHLTPEDLAPIPPASIHVPGPAEPARHFAAYYDLYPPIPQVRLPLFSSIDDCPQVAGACPEDIPMGSSAFNCMLGSGD